MSNRRGLKKNVNYIASELFTECLVHNLYIPGTDKPKSDEIMGRILTMQDEFISRISHYKSGNVKEFYRKFHKNFQEEVDTIIDEINKLN